MIRHMVLVDTGAEGRSRALQQIKILQQKRHARERAIRKSLVDLPLRIIVMLHHHGVDLRVDPGCARDGFVKQLAGADLFVADQTGEADPVITAVFLESHVDSRGAEISK